MTVKPYITYRVETYVSGGLAPVHRQYFDRDQEAAERFATQRREEAQRIGSTHKVIVIRDEPHTVTTRTPTTDIIGYKVTHTHTCRVDNYDSYDEAVSAVRTVYGADTEIGHDGDIAAGGERTLCWTDKATCADDDGARTCCCIWVRHAREVRS